MVPIQILSDLHLESPKAYDIFEVPPRAPYLALLGDIGYATKHHDDYCAFLRRQLAHFKIVFLVLGNHEPWESDWKETRRRMRVFENVIQKERSAATTGSIGEFVLLDRTRYDIPPAGERDTGLTILGCTLFSLVSPESLEDVSFGIQDFYKTEDWTVEKHSALFAEELAWLNSQVDALGPEERNIAIFTHFSPTVDSRATDPRHRNSRIASGFATDISGEICWKSPHVKFWAFGHTHFNCDFVEARKRIVAHQRGYYFSQASAFNLEKVFEI
ncbi:Ser/Thr protein phosphatase superfamily [Xylariaceae sp. FL0255]|nr:Ser/Thr protein phosphatase superfamily [Xylariaceae sp. FL0255]